MDGTQVRYEYACLTCTYLDRYSYSHACVSNSTMPADLKEQSQQILVRNARHSEDLGLERWCWWHGQDRGSSSVRLPISGSRAPRGTESGASSNVIARSMRVPLFSFTFFFLFVLFPPGAYVQLSMYFKRDTTTALPYVDTLKRAATDSEGSEGLAHACAPYPCPTLRSRFTSTLVSLFFLFSRGPLPVSAPTYCGQARTKDPSTIAALTIFDNNLDYHGSLPVDGAGNLDVG